MLPLHICILFGTIADRACSEIFRIDLLIYLLSIGYFMLLQQFVRVIMLANRFGILTGKFPFQCSMYALFYCCIKKPSVINRTGIKLQACSIKNVLFYFSAIHCMDTLHHWA